MKQLNLLNPHLLILAGVPGSGKTFFGEYFAKTYNLPLISNSRMLGMLFENPEFSSDEKAIVQRINLNELNELLKTKSTIIYDGYTDSRVSRLEVTKLAINANYTPVIVWVQTDTPTAEQRATRRGATPAPMSEEVFTRTCKKFTAPNSSEAHIVISGKHVPVSQARTVVAKLSKK